MSLERLPFTRVLTAWQLSVWDISRTSSTSLRVLGRELWTSTACAPPNGSCPSSLLRSCFGMEWMFAEMRVCFRDGSEQSSQGPTQAFSWPQIQLDVPWVFVILVTCGGLWTLWINHLSRWFIVIKDWSVFSNFLTILDFYRTEIGPILELFSGCPTYFFPRCLWIKKEEE